MTDQILHAFRRRLRRPEDAMVVSRSRRATVADIDRMARGLEGRLAELGVARGSIVALAAPNGPGFLAGLLAIRRRRCAALLHDWQTPAAEKARVGEVLGVAARVHCVRAWPRELDDLAVEPRGPEGISPDVSLSPETAVVKLTSGSTGCPRGILTSSSALVADDEALATTMGLRADERILAAIPMSHSYGLSSTVMPAIMRRSLLVLPSDPGGHLASMASARVHQATFFPTVPAFLQSLVRMGKPPRLPRSLRLVISAGASLRPTTATRFREIYGRPIHVFYGASECGGITFDRSGSAAERGTVGAPVEGVKVTLEPVAGGAGARAVVVDSPAVAESYFPEADPSLVGGRFRTRDLAVYREGELVLKGRLDDLINVRGRKVNPREVESVLARLDGVDEVVVLGVRLGGREETVVRSFLVCRSETVTCAGVQDWCRRHLASYKIPRSIVLLDEMPRTERGKLDRAALLAMNPTNPVSDPLPRPREAPPTHG